MLRKENLRVYWTCMIRPDNIDKDILIEMKASGCWQVGIGIESGSQVVLDFLRKGLLLEQIESCVTLLKRFRFNVIGYFMLGSPLESLETISETAKFIKRIKIDNMKLNFFTPYPGSLMYSEISKYGNFINDWVKLNGANPSFVPFALKEGELRYYSRKILKDFYFRPNVIMTYLRRSLSSGGFLKFFAGMMELNRYVSIRN
jgi:radical SAM superfamily enzyme YgiQ (UPF0313 family)